MSSQTSTCYKLKENLFCPKCRKQFIVNWCRQNQNSNSRPRNGMVRVLPWLYQGNKLSSASEETLNTANIKTICCLGVKPRNFPGIEYFHCGIQDDGESSMFDQFQPACEFIQSFLLTKKPKNTTSTEKCQKCNRNLNQNVMPNLIINYGNEQGVFISHTGPCALILCKGGISRSPTMTIAYLMMIENFSLDDATEIVKLVRPSANPNATFMADLKSLSNFDETVQQSEKNDAETENLI
ncbi:dual specificity phosphatase 28-like isoform X2 [Convolutriloba macropyga]|uniref:dual specificity phosphatase 28-like isoform X2 n=1 Tax=Convolutriloba macropyga TaxID=536237 RepID=UPI003F51F864